MKIGISTKSDFQVFYEDVKSVLKNEEEVKKRELWRGKGIEIDIIIILKEECIFLRVIQREEKGNDIDIYTKKLQDG